MDFITTTVAMCLEAHEEMRMVFCTYVRALIHTPPANSYSQIALELFATAL